MKITDQFNMYTEVFVKCAAEYPEKTAVQDETGRLTYGEPDTMSDNLAV